MERSPMLLKLTKMAVNGLMKLMKADIRTHGEENIPDQPCLFLINHFTRIETFFLPYVINRITGKDMLSLASSEFFGGGFGNFLEKLGAVSTGAPDRDRLMISALLKKDTPCMIFPEGQMVKDKKLVEKGKYMVYNSGIRRPPHTGSALLTLRTEFYRQKLKYFTETGNENGIKSYCDYFNIARKDVKEILQYQTNIIPVNITYYPVRARKNIVNRIAEKMVGKVSERLQEELEVEGTMLIDGVDIDINFGKPITAGDMLEKRRIISMIRDNDLYIGDNEIKNSLKFRNESTRLMYRYMKSIYSLTTVNHDHILSYMLTKYRNDKISIKDLRNRAFLIITMIKDQLQYNHTFLNRKQNSLLIDDYNDKIGNFIGALKDESLIDVDDKYIYRKKERFSRAYEFHTIRKDNIVEVLKNEIEPLSDLVRSINNLMRLPDFIIRKKLREQFLKWDMELFEKDYKKYYNKKETKPEHVGQPFFLKRALSNKGVLLIHGYLAAPQEVRELADYLFKCGYNVYGVRLRGHGTSPEDLQSSTGGEWIKSVRRGYVVMTNTVKDLAIAGFSTGAGLALLHANSHEEYKCVVSICAPLKLASIGSGFAGAVVKWNNLLRKFNIKKGSKEFVENIPMYPDTNYLRNPVNGVWELEKLMKAVEDSLEGIKIPALVIQGNNDPVVNPESGRQIFDKLGSEEKKFIAINTNNHIIVRGEDTKKVFPEIKRFLEEFL